MVIPWGDVKRRLRAGKPHRCVRLEPSEGWWVASVPGVSGAYSQGRTRASACRNLLDAIRMIEKARRRGEINSNL